MRWVTGGLGLVWLADAGLRLHAHRQPATGLGAELFPGLHLAALPVTGEGLAGLGPLASAAVALSLALLAAGAYLLVQALLDLPRARLFRLGLVAAGGVVAWTGLDVAECLLAGWKVDSLAWQGLAPRAFGLGDAALPACLLGLAGCWAGQLMQGAQPAP